MVEPLFITFLLLLSVGWGSSTVIVEIEGVAGVSRLREAEADVVLVAFVQRDCHACLDLEATLFSLPSDFKCRVAVGVLRDDATAAQAFHVHAFPSIMVFVAGIRIRFEGSPDSLTAYVRRRCLGPVTSLSAASHYMAELTYGFHAVVVEQRFMGARELLSDKLAENLFHRQDRVLVAKNSCKSHCEEVVAVLSCQTLAEMQACLRGQLAPCCHVRLPSSLLLSHEPFLRDWISQCDLPLIGEFAPHIASTYLAKNLPIVLLYLPLRAPDELADVSTVQAEHVFAQAASGFSFGPAIDCSDCLADLVGGTTFGLDCRLECDRRLLFAVAIAADHPDQARRSTISVDISDYTSLSRYAYNASVQDLGALTTFIQQYLRGEIEPTFAVQQHKSAGTGAEALLAIALGLLVRACGLSWYIAAILGGLCVFLTHNWTTRVPSEMVVALVLVLTLRRLHWPPRLRRIFQVVLQPLSMVLPMLFPAATQHLLHTAEHALGA